MTIKDCKNIGDYLKMIGAKSVDDLTVDQIFDWIHAGKVDAVTENSAWIVEHGDVGRKPDMAAAIPLLKEAIRTGKPFVCCYVAAEGVDDDGPGPDPATLKVVEGDAGDEDDDTGPSGRFEMHVGE